MKAILFVLAFLASASGLWAHSPFDNSVRATLFENDLEVSVVLGADAAQLLVKQAAPDHTGALGGMGTKSLPLSAAEQLVGLESGGETLRASRLQVLGDGLEYTFIARYPRPVGDRLLFRARYFEIAPDSMKLGTFVLADEMGRQLDSGLIQPGHTTLELVLPAPAVTQAAEIAAAPVSAVARPDAVVTSPASARSRVSFGEFVRLGVEHILTGFDHLLFLCALLVACDRVKPMIAIITCFTLAHSVTLALAALDLVSISPRIVEPLIAASIVYVGIENFRDRKVAAGVSPAVEPGFQPGGMDVTDSGDAGVSNASLDSALNPCGRMPPSLAARMATATDNLKKRCWVTLGFGLVHGFGFAGVLRESGLAEHGVALAKPLFAFNLGVEIGQLAMAAVFLPLLFFARRLPRFERHGTAAVSACVVALGGFWLMQRLLG